MLHRTRKGGAHPANAFSKVDKLGWAVALHFMHYDFCRVHQTLPITPAMEAGISEHVWSVEEIVEPLSEDTGIAV